jgi:hypothetical protein
MFDLDESIGRWRRRLSRDETVRPSDLDELESHLRDQVDGLREAGLSYEEAFLVATRRLGDPEHLSEEFAKVHGDSVWGYRFFWMTVGLLAFFLIGSLSTGVSQIAVALGAAGVSRFGLVGLPPDLLGYVLGGLGLVVHIAILGIAFALIYAGFRSGTIGGLLGPMFESLFGRIVLIALFVVAVVALRGTQMLPTVFAVRFLGPETFGRLALVRSWGSLLFSLVIPLLFLIAAIRLRPQRASG